MASIFLTACLMMSQDWNISSIRIMYLASDGTDKPYRLKVRSPIFTNVSCSKAMCEGVRIADVPAVLAQIDMCLGETDR